jgi:transcriptional regulator with XRE-family HTH domain
VESPAAAPQGARKRLEPRAEALTLRELRRRRNCSLRELEARTGINRGRLSELEHGKRWPKSSELRVLEEHFGVPGLRVAFVIVVDYEAVE